MTSLSIYNTEYPCFLHFNEVFSTHKIKWSWSGFHLKLSRMHATELHPRRFYKNHFEDSVRQCCLDLMLGNRLVEVELQDCWTYLCIVGHIAGELLPKDPPSYMPHSSLAPEFELANALYYMFRSVFCCQIWLFWSLCLDWVCMILVTVLGTNLFAVKTHWKELVVGCKK